VWILFVSVLPIDGTSEHRRFLNNSTTSVLWCLDAVYGYLARPILVT
jgi:hypothetical protein